MTDKKVQLSITSCYEHVSLVAIGICNMICSCYDIDEFSAAIELSFVEVANNVVEHAYSDEKDHEIGFELALQSDQVSITIIDTGSAMPAANMEREIDWDSLDKDDIDSWDTSGRGLQIVKDLMDEVSYWSDSGRNYFKMVKKVS
ncbi:ATP-binding protein [Thalassotalea euphylliae]|uniref:ATP-binding protein n=1 Tax=Thalassotalea euphylliae TaxID=1655234 RepID=A0A3E0TLN5_9GAMM|nr:ATP-binding protein [Thalassotalea euphylliae]REL25333.1 ATP-binding protein [Thalassotalea euphylliae]